MLFDCFLKGLDELRIYRHLTCCYWLKHTLGGAIKQVVVTHEFRRDVVDCRKRHKSCFRQVDAL